MVEGGKNAKSGRTVQDVPVHKTQIAESEFRTALKLVGDNFFDIDYPLYSKQGAYNDNFSIFFVLKLHKQLNEGSIVKIDLMGNWQNTVTDSRFAVFRQKTRDRIHEWIWGVEVGGMTEEIRLDEFPTQANPSQSEDYVVFSLHWNKKTKGVPLVKNSWVFVNGQQIGSDFTANRSPSFKRNFFLGQVYNGDPDKFRGDIARILIPEIHTEKIMTKNEIKGVHAALMDWWKINPETGKQNVIYKSLGYCGESFYDRLVARLEFNIDYMPNFGLHKNDFKVDEQNRITHLVNCKTNRYLAKAKTNDKKYVPPVVESETDKDWTSLKIEYQTFLTIPLEVKITKETQNLSIFMVVKFYDQLAQPDLICAQLFGNDTNTTPWPHPHPEYNDKCLVYKSTAGQSPKVINTAVIGDVWPHGYLEVPHQKFDNGKWYVISVHYNQRQDGSSYWVNETKQAHFTMLNTGSDFRTQQNLTEWTLCKKGPDTMTSQFGPTLKGNIARVLMRVNNLDGGIAPDQISLMQKHLMKMYDIKPTIVNSSKERKSSLPKKKIKISGNKQNNKRGKMN